MLLAATAADCSTMLLRAKEWSVAYWKALILTVLTVLYGCIGAKLLYIFENPGSPFLSAVGFSFFGSVFLELIMLPLTGWLLGIGMERGLSFCAPCIPLTLGFMRIACFVEGCCHGKVIIIDGHPFMIPTQLMELVVAAIIFVYLLRREKTNKEKLYPVFMVFYGTARFLMEFLRTNRIVVAEMTLGHIFALVCLILGIVLLRMKGGSKQ